MPVHLPCLPVPGAAGPPVIEQLEGGCSCHTHHRRQAVAQRRSICCDALVWVVGGHTCVPCLPPLLLLLLLLLRLLLCKCAAAWRTVRPQQARCLLLLLPLARLPFALLPLLLLLPPGQGIEGRVLAVAAVQVAGEAAAPAQRQRFCKGKETPGCQGCKTTPGSISRTRRGRRPGQASGASQLATPPLWLPATPHL